MVFVFVAILVLVALIVAAVNALKNWERLSFFAFKGILDSQIKRAKLASGNYVPEFLRNH